MVITLTGATGFIGRKLLERYPCDRHSLIVLSRKDPGFDPLIHFVPWDPMKEAPGTETLDRAEAVIHLAGEPVAQRWNDDVKRRIRESRVVGTRNLVDGIARTRHKPKVLICASAIGYYGDRGEEELTEASKPGTGFLPEVCVEWEREADRAEQFGVRVVKLRTGIVLGRGGGALEAMLLPFKMGVGGKLGSGRQWMSWIHVDDIIGMIAFAIENPNVRGSINGVSPNPARNAEFTKALGSALSRPTILAVPGFAAKLALGEMAGVVLSSQRVKPKAALDAGFGFAHPDLAAALRGVV